MSKAQQPQQPAREPLATLILDLPSDGDSAFHLQVLEYRRDDRVCFVHMTMPFVPDSDWPRMMPTRITKVEGGRQFDLWRRDFNKQVYPYLHDIAGELVIVFLKDGKVVKTTVVGHLLYEYEPETIETIEMKRAAAKVVGLPPEWQKLELDVIERLAERAASSAAPATESIIEVLATPPLETLATLAIVAEPKLAAAPVRAPQPAPAAEKEVAAPATQKPVDPAALARRAALTERPASTVYDIKSGAELVGIPVRTKEFNLLTVGTACVELSNKGRPKAHFVCVRTEGCPYDEHTEVTDIAPARAAAEGTGAQPGMLH